MDNNSTSSSNYSLESETPEMQRGTSIGWNSCCLLMSFLLHGMIISIAIINAFEQKKSDALYTAPPTLSSSSIASQYFSSLIFVWRGFELDRICGGIIALFAILAQIAILVLACINSHENVLLAYRLTSIVSTLVVFFWSWSFFEYINKTRANGQNKKLPCLNILALSAIVFKQTLIGVLSIIMHLQNLFGSFIPDALYFLLIVTHLLLDFLLMSELGVFRLFSGRVLKSKVTIFCLSLNLATFIAFILLSCLRSGGLSSIQTTILSITIAIFSLEQIFVIWIAIKGFRKPPSASSNDIELSSQARSNYPAQQNVSTIPSNSHQGQLPSNDEVPPQSSLNGITLHI